MTKRRETGYLSTILRFSTDFEVKKNVMSAHPFTIVVTIRIEPDRGDDLMPFFILETLLGQRVEGRANQ